MLKSIADWAEGPSLSLTAPPRRLDPISSLSTEAAAGNIVRVHEIMNLVIAGHPSENNAADLGISQHTVETHRVSIGRKPNPSLYRR